MVEFLKKYKTQIINVITIFLILEFAIYPGLTTANTISNILAGIGLLLLIIWGGLALYDYIRSAGEPKQLSDEETKQKLESELGPVIDAMAKEILADKPKKKTTKKPATKAKPKTEKVLGEFQINNKEKVRKATTRKTK
jgi:hypothetical protein